ncbi:MAG: hypothetical protein AAFY41_01680 [Bacteroidota bacterium]
MPIIKHHLNSHQQEKLLIMNLHLTTGLSIALLMITTSLIGPTTTHAQANRYPDKIKTEISIAQLTKKSDFLIEFTLDEVGFESDIGHTYYKLCNIKMLIKFSKKSSKFTPPVDNQGCVTIHVDKDLDPRNNQIKRAEGKYISFCRQLSKDEDKMNVKYNYAINPKRAIFSIFNNNHTPHIFAEVSRPVLSINLMGQMYLGKPNVEKIKMPYGEASIVITKNPPYLGLTVTQFITEVKNLINRNSKYNLNPNTPSGIIF